MVGPCWSKVKCMARQGQCCPAGGEPGKESEHWDRHYTPNSYSALLHIWLIGRYCMRIICRSTPNCYAPVDTRESWFTKKIFAMLQAHPKLLHIFHAKNHQRYISWRIEFISSTSLNDLGTLGRVVESESPSTSDGAWLLSLHLLVCVCQQGLGNAQVVVYSCPNIIFIEKATCQIAVAVIQFRKTEQLVPFFLQNQTLDVGCTLHNWVQPLTVRG